MRTLENAAVSAFIASARISEARDFYENTLGLTFVSDDEHALVFDSNGTTLRIQKVSEVEPNSYTALGWHVADIAAAVTALAEKGVGFERYDFMHPDGQNIVTFPGGARVAWFKDPDGNLLSLDQY